MNLLHIFTYILY